MQTTLARAIGVFVGDAGKRVGTLRFEAHGARIRSSFEYDAAWLAAPDRFALEPLLPLVPGPQFHRAQRDGSAFHGAIADTEPDGWGRRIILREQARRRASSESGPAGSATPILDPLDFLLAVDDVSRVGALRFSDKAGVFHRATEPGRHNIPPLIELRDLLAASRALEDNTETAADLQYLLGRATSLGGLRPKCSVIDDEGRLCIAKFPSIADSRSVTHAEVLTLHLARLAGIDAAEARVVTSRGAAIALIRRFDRPATGGRVMYISAETMLGAVAGEAVEHSYTEIVDALRQYGADAQRDIEELWRRVAFSILVTNVDDHLRNHGFLHAGNGLWRLSPAFDINPVPDRMRELKTWISPDTGPAMTIKALLSVMQHFQISKARAAQILGEVERAVARWREVGKGLGMSKRELDLSADAFEHAERDSARRVAHPFLREDS